MEVNRGEACGAAVLEARDLCRSFGRGATVGGTDLLAPDGDFGQNTWQAVRDFQAAMGLAVDGNVGNDTWRRTLDYVVDVAIT